VKIAVYRKGLANLKFIRAAAHQRTVGSRIMVIFESENELIEYLDKHDDLVRKCANGLLPFWDFVEEYRNFYWYCALDGHESDEEERQLLERYELRILPHRIVAEKILSGVCSDEDAKKPIYTKTGRFGSDTAVIRIRKVVEQYL
jgi:hypothetical protein